MLGKLIKPFEESAQILVSRYLEHFSPQDLKTTSSKTFPHYEKIGVLLIHGFTSSVKTVDGLIPYLKKAKIPYEMPILRGHGTHFKNLNGVGHQDWFFDAERALFKLLKKASHVVVVGLSMGGLVSLELAHKYPEKVVGLATVAAALQFLNPLAPFSKWISKVIPYWPSSSSFNDKSLENQCQNYPWFPTSSFCSLYDYSFKIRQLLASIHSPALVLHSLEDHTIAPQAAQIIYDSLGSQYKELKWFYRSGHEMMQDCEAEQVFLTLMDFIGSFTHENKVSKTSYS